MSRGYRVSVRAAQCVQIEGREGEATLLPLLVFEGPCSNISRCSPTAALPHQTCDLETIAMIPVAPTRPDDRLKIVDYQVEDLRIASSQLLGSPAVGVGFGVWKRTSRKNVPVLMSTYV